MGKPLIIYGLADLLNPSFEDDVNGVDPPTGWTDASVNAINAVDDTLQQSAGLGIPSLNSVQQNTDDATGGNIALLRQRVAVDNTMILLRDRGLELVAAASLKSADQRGFENAIIRIRQYDGTGTSTPATGVEETAPSERSFETAGPEWFMKLHAVTLHADTEWIDLEIVYDIAVSGYDAASVVNWDRVFLGGLVDFNKGIQSLSIDADTGRIVNAGNGVAESVVVRGPSTEFEFTLTNIHEEHPLWVSIAAFNAWIQQYPGFFAFWGDRDQLTNLGRHFQRCTDDAAVGVRYPPGFARRNYTIGVVAPNEGSA